MTHRTIAALVILTLAACSEDDQVPADAGIDVGAIADGAGDGEVPLVDGGPTVGADDAETADGDGAGAADGEADSANTPDTHEADAPFDGATVDAEDTTASVDVAPADGGADSNDGDTSSDVKVTVTPALIPLAQADFPLGVQAADPASDGALIWTRHDGWGPLRWLVLTDGADDEPGEVLASGVAQKVDGFAVVEVAGLPAGTPVRYLFTNDHDATSPDARRSPVGRFGTAPAPDELVEVTIGATSCVDVSQAPLGAIAAAADHPLDLFVWLGDTVYADGARTLEEYRDFWTESYVTSAYRALHGATSHVYTWDDHEVFNNWDPETVDPAHLAAATQAFFEHAPMRHPEEAPGRIWRSLRWGATLELFVLDCRSERLPSTKDTAPRRARLSPAVISCLELYEWPGNVRELRNAIERATLMARGDLILPEHLPKRVQEAGISAEREAGEMPRGKRMEDVERAVILQTLREHDLNRTETSRALGISRRALVYKLRRYREQGYSIEPS